MNVRCPICHTKTNWEENTHRPFCSERCRLLDLGAWASERYRVEQPDKSQTPSSDAQTGNGQKNRD